MRFIAIIFLIIFPIITNAQVNKYGFPFVTNYTAEEYNAEPQNWAVVTDKRGVVYAGNNNGILEYDGKEWRLIKIPNNSIVRSLAVDKDGIVFAGAHDEFGYLSPAPNGQMQYHSLIPLVDTLFRHFADVWKIYTTNDAVYFSTEKYLFKYDYKNITILGNSYDKRGNLFFFVPDKNIFLGNIFEGLLKLNKDVYENFLNSNFFAGKYIVGLEKINDENYLVATYISGIYIMNLNNGIDTLQTSIPAITNDLLRKSIILNLAKTNDGKFVFATNNNGIIITNRNLELENIVSEKQYLQNNIAYGVNARNPEGLVWCALDNGISKVEVNSPFRFFDKSTGFDGGILDIIEYKGNIYFGTNVGLYRLAYDENMQPEFKKIELDKSKPTMEVWKLLKINENGEEKLLAGTNFGIFYIDKDKSRKLSAINSELKSSWAIISLLQSKDNQKLYLGLSSAFIILKRDGNRYTIEKNFKLKKEIRSIYEDSNGNVWLGTHYSGIIKIDTSYQTHIYAKEQGLEVLKDPMLYSFNNDFIIATPEGLFTYDERKDSIIPYTKFGEEFSNTGIYAATDNGRDKIWLHLFDDKSETVNQLNISGDSIKIIRQPFKRVDFKGIRKLYYDSKGILWIGTPDAVYTFNTNYKKNYNIKFHTLIRKVYLKNDSILFAGTFFNFNQDSIAVSSLTQNTTSPIELDYKLNTIIFEWSAPFFEDENAIEYSFMLQGMDNNWSKWTKETKYVFTNLNEGDYVFKVKARNKYGVESSVASYSFSILPPWYRTIWAYIAYGLLLLLSIYLIVKWYTRKLKRENIRLEKIVAERTKEIRQKNAELEQQKEEIIAQAEELEIQRDLLLKKNEQIEEKNRNISASIHYASRIQSAILPPTTPFEEFFSDYFILYKPRDIVSGDFYWLRRYGNRIFVVAADCTGHGVPGAFMSMLGISLLNEIVDRNPDIDAGNLLNKLRDNVIKSLHQKEEHTSTKDGMDLTLFIFDKDKQEVNFAAANNPLILVRKKDLDIAEAYEGLGKREFKVMEGETANLVDFKPDKMPIGIHITDNKPFRQHSFKVYSGDNLYMLSDGFPDQFGGSEGQKFMIKRLKQVFLELYPTKMSEQKEILDEIFIKWINEPAKDTNEPHKQIDDVLILGVKI